MSEHICYKCGKIIKLDRKILNSPGGLTNLSYWCYSDPILRLKCFTEDVIKTMMEIKSTGEECHLINWNYTDDYVKIPVVKDIDEQNEKSGELSSSDMCFIFFGVTLVVLTISYYIY